MVDGNLQKVAANIILSVLRLVAALGLSHNQIWIQVLNEVISDIRSICFIFG
jgi:hypothetical protein